MRVCGSVVEVGLLDRTVEMDRELDKVGRRRVDRCR